MSNGKSYLKTCDRCGTEIIMQETSGKWGAYSVNGGFHSCTKEKREPPVVIENKGPEPLGLESLDARLKRIEAMLFKT